MIPIQRQWPQSTTRPPAWRKEPDKAYDQATPIALGGSLPLSRSCSRGASRPQRPVHHFHLQLGRADLIWLTGCYRPAWMRESSASGVAVPWVRSGLTRFFSCPMEYGLLLISPATLDESVRILCSLLYFSGLRGPELRAFLN